MKKLSSISMGLLMLCLGCKDSSINTPETPVEPTSNPKVEVLLVGSSHWNNYNQKGLDVAQSNEIDILSGEYQSQLADIADSIVAFNPSKIFVERTVSYQPRLDSLYQLYRTTDWGDDKRNEIYQLGFRVADMLDHSRVYGIDYHGTSFNYGEAMKAMEDAGQTGLISKVQESIKAYEETYNQIVKDRTPLKDIFIFFNNEAQRQDNLGWYYNIVNRGGDLEDFSGSFLASEWIRRNLHTYALIQKYVQPEDERIMILMGAGHTAVLHDLISYNPEWRIIPLDNIF
jgi:hypothetical protein